ncbi:hypothetical protein SLS60_009342 [Paraconiothyrium brasiliense]|uniref:Uncharacterized protein n=1 Tax=Paraconiothyrium brasiliense TaxID=300254 RepID=A0ABR3QUH6_9PLEO
MTSCGMQCPNKHTMIDDETGRKYCDKHEPPSESPEVVDWTKRMTEWLTGIANAKSSRKDDVHVSETVTDEAEAEAAMGKPAPRPESEFAPVSELEQEATDIGAIDSVPEIKLSSIELHTMPKAQQQHVDTVNQK